MNVKYHQTLLPYHLLQKLLQSLHGTIHRHPGISKMLQEIRRRYYYHSMVKHVKMVEGCKQWAKHKRVPNAIITPDLLNLPEWDLGPEDAMQIDLLLNLPPSSVYEKVLTTIAVFSQYLFPYPLTDVSAINVAKVIIDNLTKHAYLPKTLITDKGTAFTSTNIAQITLILIIRLKLCNDQSSTDNREAGTNTSGMHLSRPISKWHVGNIADNGINTSCFQF